MAYKRIPDLDERIDELGTSGYMEFVDVSDTSDDPAGSTDTVMATGSNLLTYGHNAPLGHHTLLGAIPTSDAFAVTIGLDRIHFSPFTVAKKLILTEVMVPINGAGAGGATCRLGIFNTNEAFNGGGSLLADFGVVLVSSTGQKVISSLGLTLEPGNYFHAIVASSNVNPLGVRAWPLNAQGGLLSISATTSSLHLTALYSDVSNAWQGLPSTMSATPTKSYGAGTGVACHTFCKWTEV